MIESESKILPLISKALASQGKDESGVAPKKASATEKKRPMDEKMLEEIIKDEFS